MNARAGLAFAAMAVASVWTAPGLFGFAGAALAALMCAIAVSDWRRYRVPDPLVALALLLRAILCLLETEPLEAARAAGVRAFVAAALFWLFRWAYRRLRGREGLGFGDVKLAAVAGAWVDWPLLPWVIEAAAIAGIAIALLRRRRALTAQTRVPFAVGFAPAIWLGWWLQTMGV